jgi:glycosyltransferase involved in cell wall biosynthesis
MNKEKEYMPSITVLMAVYNGERWLAESIQSVLEQTFTNFEFIIINDGSDDGSLQIINQFSKKDSRIRVYNKKNSGLADSLNYGIAEARGEWIARIDADDICSLDRLQKQIEHVRLNTDLVLVGSGLVIIDENGQQSKVHLYPDRHSRLTRRLFRASPFFAHSSAFFKLCSVRELGGYRTQFHRSQDQDLWLRLAETGRIACVREPLVLIRKHTQQISLDNSGQRQFVYSHMAMTSYCLRLMGQVDPVKLSTKEEFDNFRTFILQRLKDDNFFEYQELVDELKVNISKANTKYAKLNIVAKNTLLKPDLVYRYLKYRFLGSNLPIKFAREWIKYDN